MKKIPQHVAIIMDGNGRWAKKQGFATRVRGHEIGVEALRRAATGAAELGIRYLTVYAFSEENWQRPKAEVDALMNILMTSLSKELPVLQENGIRLHAIGNLDALPSKARRQLDATRKATAGNERMVLTLALSYGSRQEILGAVKDLARRSANGEIQPEGITEADIAQALWTHDLPDPELVIRTSGEQRISNFLLWQISYAEFVFLPVLWPDFSKEDLVEALEQYAGRERRLGKTSEQLTA
ncbi:MAG: isoprenyl transferase [Schleiferiaceae bacterium]|nr:isoprenyl transferase [Schleiferiaceae bacterium]